MKLGLTLVLLLLAFLTVTANSTAFAESDEDVMESSESDGSVPVYDSEEVHTDEGSAVDIEE